MKNVDQILCVSVEGGALCIRIGVNTLADAVLHSPFVSDLIDNSYSNGNFNLDQVHSRFQIEDKIGFANDVLVELLAEREDGSSLLTDLFDAASQNAIEQGSEYFIDKEE